eukprot:GSChrysophyteH2.ASY1.ANO1.836.1 assembled CDS
MIGCKLFAICVNSFLLKLLFIPCIPNLSSFSSNSTHLSPPTHFVFRFLFFLLYYYSFDYAIVFLESDKFDAAVMDFVDEKCDVFDSEDENKFVYSDIHNEFREHIEALITSNLGEVGVTVEMFYESCELAGQSRDVNRAVFERMLAMEDFNTFKRIMVKRNMELQILAMQEPNDTSPYTSPVKPNQLKSSIASPMSPEEEKEQLDRALSASLSPEHSVGGARDTDIMQASLRNSLLEMEMVHRQEELEQAELMKAVALSLAIEEERLNVLAEASDDDEDADADVDESDNVDRADSKGVGASSSSHSSQNDDGNDNIRNSHFEQDNDVRDIAPPKKAKKTKKKSKTTSDSKDFEPLKPLNLRPLGGLAALPPIRSEPVPSREEVERMQMQLAEKKREAENVIRESQQQLAVQRKNEESLKRELSKINPEESDRRAEQMRNQRDRLLAKKKAEREKKVAAEEERTRKEMDEKIDNRPKDKIDPLAEYGVSRAEIEESRRGAMRNALARRMKMELVESKETRVAKAQEVKFSELEVKLKQVEKLRADSRLREQALQDKMTRVKGDSGVEDF